MGDTSDAYCQLFSALTSNRGSIWYIFLYEDWNLYPLCVCLCVFVFVCVCVVACVEKPLELLT